MSKRITRSQSGADKRLQSEIDLWAQTSTRNRKGPPTPPTSDTGESSNEDPPIEDQVNTPQTTHPQGNSSEEGNELNDTIIAAIQEDLILTPPATTAATTPTTSTTTMSAHQQQRPRMPRI